MTFLQDAKPAVVPHNTEFPFRRPCLATIFYARFLHTSSEDDRTRTKALLQDEMELYQRGPIWYDLWNSLASVIEGRGTLQAVQEAIEMRSQLLDQDSPNKQQYVLDLSNSLSNLTILQRDEYKESSEGVRPTRHVLHQDPETIQCKLGCALTNLADRFIEINLPNQSVDAAKKSVEIFNSFPKEAHRDELALALFSYYNALFGIGVYDQALSEIKKATNILSQNTSTLDINISLLIYSNVFLQHSFLGNEEDARSALLKVRALVDSSASYPTSVEPELGRSLLRSSSGCQKLGDWEEAANACEDAVKVFRRLV